MYHLYSVGKRFGSVQALSEVSLRIVAGSLTVLTGRSGSGKSTLLALCGLLTPPTTGEMLFDGRRVVTFSAKQRRMWRLLHVGMMLQAPHLLPMLTAWENVALSAILSRAQSKREVELRARRLLNEVGLSAPTDAPAYTLSGGEKRKVALARALFQDPPAILADEPSDALDDDSTRDMMEVLVREQRKGKVVLVATHDVRVLRYADAHAALEGGFLRTVADDRNAQERVRGIEQEH